MKETLATGMAAVLLIAFVGSILYFTAEDSRSRAVARAMCAERGGVLIDAYPPVCIRKQAVIPLEAS